MASDCGQLINIFEVGERFFIQLTSYPILQRIWSLSDGSRTSEKLLSTSPSRVKTGSITRSDWTSSKWLNDLVKRIFIQLVSHRWCLIQLKAGLVLI